MAARKYKPTILGELKNFVRFIVGRYKNFDFKGHNLKIHKNIYNDFKSKLDNLEILSQLMDYDLEFNNCYSVYKKDGIFVDSITIEYRFTSRNQNTGYLLELTFNPGIKTLRRIYSLKIGDRNSYHCSRLKNHVTRLEDLSPIDFIINNL